MLLNRYRGLIAISYTLIVCLFYSNVLWALPSLNQERDVCTKETLAPQSDFAAGILSKLDSDAAGLLTGILRTSTEQERPIDLDTLWEWIQNANVQKECVPVRKDGEKIVILAKGLNIEFSVSASVNSCRLPNSDIFVSLNYYPSLREVLKYAGLDPLLSEDKQDYILGNLARLADSLKKIVRENNHEEIKQIKIYDLDSIVNLDDEEKDKFINSLVEYLNSGKGMASVLLGNYFDMKGVYAELARRGVDADKLKNIYALYKFTFAGDEKDPKKYLPPRNLLGYPPIAKGGQPFMPLYQFVYNRTLNHRFEDKGSVSIKQIRVEEFSPFFERDAVAIEDLEIGSWKQNAGIVLKREWIRERHRRNPVYIIREGGRILGGIATSCLKINGEYSKKIPKTYAELIRNHDPHGDTVFDYSVFARIERDSRIKKKYGDILALATLEASKLQGKREVVAASRSEVLTLQVSRRSGTKPKDVHKIIASLLEQLRVELVRGADYQFVLEEVLPFLIEKGFLKDSDLNDLEGFIWKNLPEDPFLNAFHHALGSKDVLVIPNSRMEDIRGLGANVYTSYYDKMQGITANPKDREELERQIFGRYYEATLAKIKSRSEIKGLLRGKTPAEKSSKLAYDFSVYTRERNFDKLHEVEMDVLIIGGGIVGAGIARDASLRGLKVGLVEKGDYGSGTSSKSSKLIHAGLRYLEYMPDYLKAALNALFTGNLKKFIMYIKLIWRDSLKLVFEASRERRILLKLAPHLVRPLRFVIPVYEKKARLLKVFLGTWLYDILSLFMNTRVHETLFTTGAVTDVESGVNREALKGGVLYYDAQTNDARLVLENILSANKSGAVITNYTEVIAITYDGKGRINGAIVEDKLTGRKFTVKAKRVVNAGGPWIDKIRKMDNIASDRENTLLHLTKGSHIIVPRISDNAVVISTPDKRSIFVIPMDANRSLIGTTDIDLNPNGADLDNLMPASEEIDYLLKEVNRVFPNAGLTVDDVISGFTGVRPMVESVEGGGSQASRVSRAHEIFQSPTGLISVGGVKITSYRLAAQEVTDRIFKELRPFDDLRCETDKTPIFGQGISSIDNYLEIEIPYAVNKYDISEDIAEYVIRKYGSNYHKVLGLTHNNPEIKERIFPGLPYIKAEVVYSVHYEMVISLKDFVMRRTDIDFQKDINIEGLWEIARLLGSELDWSEGQIREEVKEYVKYNWTMRNRKIAKAKFTGIPVVEEVASEIIQRSDVNILANEDLDEVEALLAKLCGEDPEFKLPEDLNGLIMAKLFDLIRIADESLRNGGVDNSAEGRAERKDVLSIESDLAHDYLFTHDLPKIISLSRLMEYLKDMRARKAIKTFNPKSEQDLRYFMVSQDQQTSAILLREKKRDEITGGECYILAPVWEHLNAIKDPGQRGRLKAALLLHELVEEMLFSLNVPHLIAHYAAEIFERFVLEEETDLKGESRLDSAIKEHFGRPREVKKIEHPLRIGWVKEHLGATLTEFAQTVSAETVIHEILKDLPPYRFGVKELINRLSMQRVRDVLRISEQEALFITEILIRVFLDPENGEVKISNFIGGFQKDNDEFPALLNLYIERLIMPTRRFLGRKLVLSNDTNFLGTIAQAGRDRITYPQTEQTQMPIVPFDFEALEASGAIAESHMHYFIKKLIDAFAGTVHKRTGQTLDKHRLREAVQSVIFDMQAKDPNIVKKFMISISAEPGLKLEFKQKMESLFRYDRKKRIMDVNLDAIECVGNPEALEVLFAVGLVGDLLLSSDESFIDILFSWQVDTNWEGEFDARPDIIRSKQSAINTIHILNRYGLTPAGFICLLDKIARPDEEYIQQLASYANSLENHRMSKNVSVFEFASNDLDELSDEIRKKIFKRDGVISLNLPKKSVSNRAMYKKLASEIAEGILGIHLPSETRADFISGTAEMLADLLIDSVIAAGGSEEIVKVKVIWGMDESQVVFRIEYPKGRFDKADKGGALILKKRIGGVAEQRTKGMSSSHSGLIGKGISPAEVKNDQLKPVLEEETVDVITSLERRLETLKRDGRSAKFVEDIERCIQGIKDAVKNRKLYQFEATVKGNEKYLLGFADGRGISLCNEFFQKGNKLNKVLDEALFHEIYHMLNLHTTDQQMTHEKARRIQEVFFADEIHYEQGSGQIGHRSLLRKYARALIDKKVIRKQQRKFDSLTRVTMKIIDGDSDLALLSNIGALSALLEYDPIFSIFTTFDSMDEAKEYFKQFKSGELIRLLARYYVINAYRGLLDKRQVEHVPNSSPKIDDEDMVRSLADMLKNNFKLELSGDEDDVIAKSIRKAWKGRKRLVKDYEKKIRQSRSLNLTTLERIRREQRQRVEERSRRFINIPSTKMPGMLYFDLDKILNENPETASAYLEILDQLSKVDQYAVVLVNTCPDKTINERLGELTRMIGRVIKLDAVSIGRPGEGNAFIQEAVRLASLRLKTDIHPENITLAIYAPNRWMYPQEFLKDFAVIVMSPKPMNIDEKQIERLEQYLPGIRTLIIENKVHLLRKEIEEIKELEDELGISLETRKQVGQGA